MAEQLLDDPDVGAVVEHVGRARVAEHVRATAGRRGRPGRPAVAHDLPAALAGEPATRGRSGTRHRPPRRARGAGRYELGPAAVEVVVERAARRPAPIGTTRSLPPCRAPGRGRRRGRGRARSRPTSSLIRSPLAYSVSRIARSRSAVGPSPATAPSSASTSASVSAFGIPCGTRGAPTSSLGSRVDEPLVDAEAVERAHRHERPGDRRRRVRAAGRRRRARRCSVARRTRATVGSSTSRGSSIPRAAQELARSGAGRGGTRRASSGASPRSTASQVVVLGEQLVERVGRDSRHHGLLSRDRARACARAAADDALGVDELAPRDQVVDVGERDALDRHRRLLGGGGVRRRRAASRSSAAKRYVYSSQKPGDVVELGQQHEPARRGARSPPRARGARSPPAARRRRRACPPGPRAARGRPRRGTGARAAPSPLVVDRARPTTAPGWRTTTGGTCSPSGALDRRLDELEEPVLRARVAVPTTRKPVMTGPAAPASMRASRS